MNCPLCSAKAAEGATECPSCGALFAKLKKRAEREKQEAEAALALVAAAPPISKIPIWKLRIAAAMVVIAWIIGFGLYFRRWMSQEHLPPKRRVYDDNTVLRMRDPITGEIKNVKVHVAPKIVRPDQSPPAWSPGRSDPPAGAIPHDPDFDD